MKFPLSLRRDAERKCYLYFSKFIRQLPLTEGGEIDTLQKGFHDNDVDAFRHAYVSGVFSQEYGETAASIIGWANEIAAPSSPTGKNMDLWNNEVDRKLARTNKTSDSLLEAVRQALLDGELIVHPSDSRKHVQSQNEPAVNGVIVLKKDSKGANEVFYDINSSRQMSREEFVTAISSGQYPKYEIRRINGVSRLFSKRDRTKSNNLS